jgi:hypothetical protein
MAKVLDVHYTGGTASMWRAIGPVVVVLLLGRRLPAAVTSGDDPSAPVPFRWSLNESPRPDGHRLRLFGGTMHSIPSSVRLVSPGGQVVASALATFSTNGGLCGDTQSVGTASAELPLAPAEAPAFRGSWPAGYRIEAEVGGAWRPVTLTYAGCKTAD